MDTSQVAFILVAALVVIGVAAFWTLLRRRRSEALQRTFGSSYDRAVERHGSRARAEADLEARQRRFEKAQIRALAEADRNRYLELWRGIQARFVDNPAAAVGEADYLVAEVMRVRGYPAGDFEQRLADVAIGHPHLVGHYRGACEISERSRNGRASTEDLRQALVHYRALFDDLLSAREREAAAVRH